jgi:TniQ protein
MPATRLPIAVPLVRAETLPSYLTRLADANHLPLPYLRASLGMTRTNRPDLDQLAALTGHPAQRLTDMLIGTAPPPGRTKMSPLPAGRPACRRCLAARGIHADVDQVAPDQRVCARHRRWLGGPTEGTVEQYDLTQLPLVVNAQRRHHRLLRAHGAEDGRTAIYWAKTIVARWVERRLWTEHRDERLTAYLAATGRPDSDAPGLLAMVSYPETITLARLLADHNWAAIAAADRPRDRADFDREVGRRLHIPFSARESGDPLVVWQEGQALVRRMRESRLPPDPRRPEVWLSLAGEPAYLPSAAALN